MASEEDLKRAKELAQHVQSLTDELNRLPPDVVAQIVARLTPHNRRSREIQATLDRINRISEVPPEPKEPESDRKKLIDMVRGWLRH